MTTILNKARHCYMEYNRKRFWAPFVQICNLKLFVCVKKMPFFQPKPPTYPIPIKVNQ